MSIYHFNDPVRIVGATFKANGEPDKLACQFYNGYHQKFVGKPLTMSAFDFRGDVEGELEAAIEAVRNTQKLHKYYASLCIEDGGGYVTIHAPDHNTARAKMFASKYGKKWAFLYDESEKAEALDQYEQQEVGVVI